MTRLPGPDAERWDRLAMLSGNIFATREWSECWWKHFGRSGSPIVLTDDERNPTVILPLYRSGGLVRQLRIIGHGPADQLGPLCAPEHVGLAGEMLRDLWHDSPRRWDVMVLNDVPVDAPWVPGSAHELRREASPVVRFDTRSWEELLAAKSRNFRQQVRGKVAKAERDCSPVYRLASSDTLAADLDTLFRLHSRRWGTDAAFAHGVDRGFHADFAAIALERGWLRLWILELDGVPVGAMHGFRFAGADYFHQGGWDPAFDRYSPGFLLCVNAMRTALEDGMTEFRLLRGDEDYKTRFANGDHPVRSVAVASGSRGRLAIRAAHVRRAS